MVRDILTADGGCEQIMQEMDNGEISRKSRIKVVRILVSYLMEHHGER